MKPDDDVAALEAQGRRRAQVWQALEFGWLVLLTLVALVLAAWAELAFVRAVVAP